MWRTGCSRGSRREKNLLSARGFYRKDISSNRRIPSCVQHMGVATGGDRHDRPPHCTRPDPRAHPGGRMSDARRFKAADESRQARPRPRRAAPQAGAPGRRRPHDGRWKCQRGRGRGRAGLRLRRATSGRSIRRDGDEREQRRQQDVADDDEGERDHGTASCESTAECAGSSDQRTTSDPSVNRP
jgi:hypothetical protein